ncbi:MAG: hypothetical protein R3F55_17780 [Alphaproteobacteria bacterium]
MATAPALLPDPGLPGAACSFLRLAVRARFGLTLTGIRNIGRMEAIGVPTFRYGTAARSSSPARCAAWPGR